MNSVRPVLFGKYAQALGIAAEQTGLSTSQIVKLLMENVWGSNLEVILPPDPSLEQLSLIDDTKDTSCSITLPERKISMAISSKTKNQISRISFDLGNRFNAITDGKTIINFPSYSLRKSSRQDVDYSTNDFVNDLSFDVSFGGNSFLVGQIAGSFLAKPTFGGDKWKLVKQFFYAGVSGLVPQDAVIENLLCTVPDDQDEDQRSPFLNLKGVHNFTVNGREFNVTVKGVIVAAEGKFAWYRALKEGLYQYPKYLNGVLDLGGGTAIARLFHPDGTIVRDYDLVLDGATSALAAHIAVEVGLIKSEGQILDAIADGTFAVHAINFKTAYDAILPEWIDDIQTQMRTRWKEIHNQFAQILVIGGSAPIIAPFVQDNPRYVIAPNPQFYALEGLQSA